MTDSILNSVKKVLGLDSDYTPFDTDVIMHINATFSTLNQLGVGPVDGFEIEDEVPVWGSYLRQDQTMNFVKTYVYLKVRLLFDPPSNSFTIAAMEKQITELEWRINVAVEPVITTDTILDGGAP